MQVLHSTPSRPEATAVPVGSVIDFDDVERADDLLAELLAWPQRDGSLTVRCNMIASIDGGATLDGRSGGMGIPVDQKLIGLNRDLADAVLIGAGTVIAENYPGCRNYPKRGRRRERWGIPGLPRWVIVASRALPPDLPAVTGGDIAPIIVTTDEVPTPDGVEVIRTGAELDLAEALRHLPGFGIEHLLCEGGPTLLGQLATAGLIDEWCLTIAPLLLGTGSTTPLLGQADLHADPPQLDLLALLAEGSHLFARYRTRR